ncbi:1189_t:CDS:2, partial [Racocetra persica]
QEKDTRKREKYRKNPKPGKEIICYRCGEKGHIARFCISEKRSKEHSEKATVQPDIPEKRPKVQPELKWNNRLRPRAENELLLVDVGDLLQPMELEEARMVKKIRRKREPS